VYVHCTAGIYRSPQLIILFLVSFRQFGLSEATELVKRKRPYARPESGCLEVSLEQLQCEKENFEN
jgi:protein-tyrosine phosphatase